MRLLDFSFVLGLLSSGLVTVEAARGGTSAQDAIRFAYVPPNEESKTTDPLRDLLKVATALEWEIVTTASDKEAVNMVLQGQAEIAFPDSGAMLGQEQALLGLVAETTIAGSNQPFYTASAIVRTDSPFEVFSDLQGRRSCHTGITRSAGTLMPIGYGVSKGIINDQSGKLADTVRQHFTLGSCAAPAICGQCKDNKIDGQCNEKDPYFGYAGALRCLSEDAGDVAFVRSTTPETECRDANPIPAWCLDFVKYRILASFGKVPSHAIVSKTDALTANAVSAIKTGLEKTTEAANKPLLQFFGRSRGFAAITSVADHMKDYSANLACVPEINDLQKPTTHLTCNKEKPFGRTGSTEEPIRWAFSGNTAANVAEAALKTKTGLTFRMVSTQGGDQTAVEMVTKGLADITSTDSVSAIRSIDQLDLVVVEKLIGGLPFYSAVSMVRKDSGINSISDLKGKKSCHTGFQKSAGMYVPMGYYVQNRKIPAHSTLKATLVNYFTGGQCAIPKLCSICKTNRTDDTCTTKDAYSSYEGALRCLSEGAGDIGFMKHTTWDTACGIPNRPAWCKDLNSFKVIDTTGDVPSHPVVAKKGALSSDGLNQLINALKSMSNDNADDQNLFRMLGGKDLSGYQDVGRSVQGHVQQYVNLLSCLPESKSLLAVNNLPACKMVDEPQPATDAAAFASIKSYQNTTRSIAVAALVLVCLAIAIFPVLYFFLGRRQVTNWISGAQMHHMKQSDFDKERL
eukprot:Ihof_evm21s7 gene=Ihof_evmTU21s7